MKTIPPINFLIYLLLILLCFSGTTLAELEGRKSKWNGFTKTDFTLNGYSCFVVEPKKKASGKPWVWRACFPTYHS
jgi:hypothetical protein